MSWVPDYQTLRHSELSDAAFLAAGRALHICHRFESTLKWVLQVAEAEDHLKNIDEPAFQDLQAAFNKFKNRLLMNSFKALQEISDIKKSDIELLENAIDARNYIAHEATLFFSARDKWLTLAAIQKLRYEVGRLCSGANLMFSWSYEIENREHSPQGIFQEYPKLADDWVFGHLKLLLEENENRPEVAKAETSLLEYRELKKLKKDKI